MEGRGDVSKGWVSPQLEQLFFTDSPHRTLYHLEVGWDMELYELYLYFKIFQTGYDHDCSECDGFETSVQCGSFPL